MKQKPTPRPRQQNCGCHGGCGAREGVWWEFGASRSELFYVGWIDSEAPLYSTADCIPCLVIKNHHGKEHEHENCSLTQGSSASPAVIGDRCAGILAGLGRRRIFSGKTPAAPQDMMPTAVTPLQGPNLDDRMSMWTWEAWGRAGS